MTSVRSISMPPWHSALPETTFSGTAADQQMKNSVFAGTLTQTVVLIHSRVVTNTFVFTAPLLSIRARVVRALRTLRKAKNERIFSPRSRKIYYPHLSRILLQQILLDPRLRIALYVSTLGTRNFLTTPIDFFILDGLRFGFKLIPESDPSCLDAYESDNHSSATCPDFKPEMDSLFTKELALGRISMVQTKLRCVHPIGRVPKKDSGKSRPITDCSRPHGLSLNDHIKDDLESFRMNSIDTAVSFSTPNCFYSIVGAGSGPVVPPHRELQGFRWMFGTRDSSQHNYYVDNRLCFGVSCAPSISNRISNAIARMMARRGFRAVVNYLDDLLIIGSTQEECQRGLVTLINLLHYLGFNVTRRKVVSPTQRITFLGIELDSSTMSFRLPEDKLNRLIDLMNTFSHKASASKRQLQSLAGSLNFACQVVHGGRTFLRRVIDCN